MAGRIGEEKPRDMGYCFSDASSSGNHQNILVSHLQTFEPTPGIYNLAAGVDMIEFQPKSMHDLTAISGTINETLMVSPDTSSAWNNHHYHHHHQSRSLIFDDPSLRCVFTCEGNERPSRGLSLSLSSSDPSSIGLQPFELRQHDDLRFGPSSSRSVNFEQQPQGYSHVKKSKYLGPVQELLSEFCNLGINQNDGLLKMKAQKSGESEDDKKQPLLSLDLLELQRRKTKLLQMLDEVDRRYRHYCDQMKGVTSLFEAVAGNGAAAAYSALASKAISRHFRSLRDGIVKEIKATKKNMGEKDIYAVIAPAGGETPRLRLLDQTLRQKKALQQMNMMENHPWRPQRGLPERSVSVLRAWLFEHFLHPYPSDVDKHILARQTGLSRSQVSNWFINARVRLWKPMVEEMYLEELKEKDDAAAAADVNDVVQNQNNNPSRNVDEKPTQDQLVRIDSECLSSIINNPDKKKNKTLQNSQPQHFGSVGDSYDAMELDFSSYNPHLAGGGGGGVSLSLGLHQHGEGGRVSLAFSTPSQSSLFYPRDQIEDCQTVPYSLLNTENQSLQYRNLMGAQLLHDLTG